MKYKNFKEMKDKMLKKMNEPLKKGQFMDNSFDIWLNEQHEKAYKDDKSNSQSK